MDNLISLVVILVTLAAVALIFWISARRRQALRLRLRAYCEQRRLEFREESDRLRSAFVILGDRWRLETGSQASERGSDSGSPEVIAYTLWSGEAGPVIPRVRFGTTPGASPGQAAAFLPLLARLAFTAEDAGLVPLPLKPPLDRRFVLLALPGTEGGVLGERAESLLASWPEAWEVRGTIGPDQISLSIPAVRTERAQDLDAVIELGKALMEKFSPDFQERPEDKEESPCGKPQN